MAGVARPQLRRPIPSIAAATTNSGFDPKSRKKVDICRSNRIMCGSPRGNSSVGRARPCQGRGREFESRFPLQFRSHACVSAMVKKAAVQGRCVEKVTKPRPTEVFVFYHRHFTPWVSHPSMRRGGRVVMQRPAKPCTPVRFRPSPPSACASRLANSRRISRHQRSSRARLLFNRVVIGDHRRTQAASSSLALSTPGWRNR